MVNLETSQATPTTEESDELNICTQKLDFKINKIILKIAVLQYR